jgi:predicted metal-dependent hydrolase
MIRARKLVFKSAPEIPLMGTGELAGEVLFCPVLGCGVRKGPHPRAVPMFATAKTCAPVRPKDPSRNQDPSREDTSTPAAWSQPRTSRPLAHRADIARGGSKIQLQPWRSARRPTPMSPVQLSLDFDADVKPVPLASGSGRVPVPSVVAPAPTWPARLRYAHPEANREIDLGVCTVAYSFKRARRRTIGMRIGASGLEVRAPQFCLIGEVQRVLRERGDWIVAQLHAAEQRQVQHQQQRVFWGDGGSVPYLGGVLRLSLSPAHDFVGPGAHWDGVWDDAQGEAQGHLWVALPHHASESQVRDVVQAWLMRQAMQHFTQRLDHFAPQLGVQWTQLKLSSATTRWGSAGRDGRIRLNWRLMHGAPTVIDYVVVHELSHLREMNHSPRFWQTVASIMPDYKTQQRELHGLVPPPL